MNRIISLDWIIIFTFVSALALGGILIKSKSTPSMKKGPKPILVLLLCGVLCLHGCVPANPGGMSTTIQPVTTSEIETETPFVQTEFPTMTMPTMKGTQIPDPAVSPSPGVMMTIEPGLTSLVEQAIADLSLRLNIEADEIIVIQAQSVVWSDGSLGCPQPGMEYIQVLTEGARIVLQAEGKLYDYHSGGRRGAFLCEHTIKAPYSTLPVTSNRQTPPPADDSFTP